MEKSERNRRCAGRLGRHDDGATIRAHIAERIRAGATHVCLQVLTASPLAAPRDEWRALASLAKAPDG